MVLLYFYWGALLPEVPEAERLLPEILRHLYFDPTVMQLHWAGKTAVENAPSGHAA